MRPDPVRFLYVLDQQLPARKTQMGVPRLIFFLGGETVFSFGRRRLGVFCFIFMGWGVVRRRLLRLHRQSTSTLFPSPGADATR